MVLHSLALRDVVTLWVGSVFILDRSVGLAVFAGVSSSVNCQFSVSLAEWALVMFSSALCFVILRLGASCVECLSIFSFFSRVVAGHVFLCSMFHHPSVGCITCRMFFSSSFAPLAFSLRVQFPEWSVQPLVAVPWGEPISVYSHIAVQFLADSDVYF